MIAILKKKFESKLIKNSIWMVLLQIFNTIVPILTLPYITRILSPVSYGSFSLALNWIGYFQVIVEYGFELTGSRKIAMRKSNENLNEVYSSIILSRIILFIGCLVLFGIIIFFTPIEKNQVICMLILFLMVFATVFEQTWFFQGISEMQNITIINVFSRGMSVVLIFTLVKKAEDLYLYCFLYVSNYLISGIIGCFIVYKKYKVKFKMCSIKLIFKEISDGWYLFLSSVMTKIFGGIGITVLGIISTKSDVGIFSAINKIPYVLTILFLAISRAIYPFNCKKFEYSFEDGVKNVKKVAIPIILMFSIIGVVLIILHYPIVKYIFGNDYAQKAILLIPFIIWVIFGIINNFLGIQTLVASGHQKEYSKAFQISVCIMCLLMLTMGRVWKIYGVAMASMFSEIIFSLILLKKIKDIKK